ncbi:hypothetical protein RB653_001084 [Dictyostelium firmibasis]|uniref:Fucosyltransferase n=1 Tax=Dictyostelium firmibasis TaxID=79012 RepID=A0AAN7YUX9_9MYCE
MGQNNTRYKIYERSNRMKNYNIYNLDNDISYDNSKKKGEKLVEIKDSNITRDQFVYLKYVGDFEVVINKGTAFRCQGIDGENYYLVGDPAYDDQRVDLELYNDFIILFKFPEIPSSPKAYIPPRALLAIEPQVYRTCQFDPKCVGLFNFKISFDSDSDVRIGFDSSISSAFLEYRKSLDQILQIQSQFRKEYEMKKLNNTLEPHQTSFPLANWFCSNCNNLSNRNELVKELMKYITVDSYGSCLNNMPTSDFLKRSSEDPFNRKRNFIVRYKFTIVFENSICKDYVSEKVLDALAGGSVPVYMGHLNTLKYLPYKSFIFVGDFDSIEDLANYLKYLDQNQEEYNKYQIWRTNENAIEQWKGVNNYPNKPGFRINELLCPLLRQYQRSKNGIIPFKQLRYVPLKNVCFPPDFYFK